MFKPSTARNCHTLFFKTNFKMGNDTFISLGFLKISLVSSYSLKRWIYCAAQNKSNVWMVKFLNEQWWEFQVAFSLAHVRQGTKYYLLRPGQKHFSLHSHTLGVSGFKFRLLEFWVSEKLGMGIILFLFLFSIIYWGWVKPSVFSF